MIKFLRPYLYLYFEVPLDRLINSLISLWPTAPYGNMAPSINGVQLDENDPSYILFYRNGKAFISRRYSRID